MQFDSPDEVKVDGYMNITHRQWIREKRRVKKLELEELWGDTAELIYCIKNGVVTYEDIFQLKKLFEIEPYDKDIPFGSENWDEEPSSSILMICKN